jgi:hypothetical protein
MADLYLHSLAAVALAADQAIKGSTDLRLTGLLETPLWSYAPLALIGLRRC